MIYLQEIYKIVHEIFMIDCKDYTNCATLKA